MGAVTKPPAWAVLEQALLERKPVRLHYQGTERTVCPQVLGWKNGRAKALLHQIGGATSRVPLPADPRQRWRSSFVDEIENPVIVPGACESAGNFSLSSNCVDVVSVAVGG